jgi:uncharacterized protein (TIGR02145 family)
VKKMPDGRIWMVQDLRYGGDGFAADSDKCANKTTFNGGVSGPKAFWGKYGDCMNYKIAGQTPDARGYMYDWAAVMQDANAYNGGSSTGCTGMINSINVCKGICPAGFHVPTKEEFIEVYAKFQSAYGCSNGACWNPSSAWEGVYGGWAGGTNNIDAQGSKGNYWGGTSNDTGNGYSLYFVNNGELGDMTINVTNRHVGLTLRCVSSEVNLPPDPPTITQGSCFCTGGPIEFTATVPSGSTLHWTNVGGGTATGNTVNITMAAATTTVEAYLSTVLGSATCIGDPTTKTAAVTAANCPSAGGTHSTNNFNPAPCAPVGSTWTISDTRDSKTYTVKKMADGHIWMVQDLKYGGAPTDNCATLTTFTGSTSTSNVTSNLFGTGTFGGCRKNSDVANSGYYYDWAAVMQNAEAYRGGSYAGCTGTGASANACRGLCPEGFHVPTNDEFKYTKTQFEKYDGCSNSACWNESSAWQGARSGIISDGNNSPADANHYANYHCSTPNGVNNVLLMSFQGGTGSVTVGNGPHGKQAGFTLRCVRNY